MESGRQVHFYLPYWKDKVRELPAHADKYWPWLLSQTDIDKGKYGWTLQTYLQLADAGFDCQLSQRLPESGIVISHRDFLPIFMRPRPSVFLVCIKPDRKRHTWAQAYVVQNENDALRRNASLRARTVALPYWPQPCLLPRDTERKQRCENVAYFGRDVNLTRELRSLDWASRLRELDFNWSIKSQDSWHDYRSTDVMVAVRQFAFTRQSSPVFDPDSKPPSKLINAWLAGVPAIVGRDSAFRDIRQSDLDFIEVSSAAEIVDALLRLRRNSSLYRAMSENGLERSRSYSVESCRQRWCDVLEGEVTRAYVEWVRSPWIMRILNQTADTIRYFGQLSNLRDIVRVVNKSVGV